MPATTFFTLPAELRLKIYYYLVPRDAQFDLSVGLGAQPPCIERHSRFCRTILLPMTLQVHHHIHWYRYYDATLTSVPGIEIQLLRVNKQMYNEVSTILYGENTFHFNVGRHIKPVKRYNSRFRGHDIPRHSDRHERTPFKPIDGRGSDSALRFLSDDSVQRMTKVEVIIQANLQSTAKIWLAKFVERFQTEQRLKHLLVAFFYRQDALFRHHHRHGPFHPFPQPARPLSHSEEHKIQTALDVGLDWQYTLEPLITLAPIAKVEIYGHVSDTFKAQLLSILTSSGAPAKLKKLEYPERVVYQKVRGKQRRAWKQFRRKAVTDPDYDWTSSGEETVGQETVGQEMGSHETVDQEMTEQEMYDTPASVD